MNPVKDAVLALFEPSRDELEQVLPVAPDVSIEIIVCPHCEGTNSEVWSTEEARMANCMDCGAEFTPPVLESRAKSLIHGIHENRMRARRKLMRSGVTPQERHAIKGELFRMFSQ
jgi:Zn ribbon nucleic-acid-binding protein